MQSKRSIQTGVCDLTRGVDRKFGAILQADSLPCVTTRNNYLWLVGSVEGKVAGLGRYLRWEEKCECMGFLASSLVGVLETRHMQGALGNSMVVSSVGRALAPIHRIMRLFEVQQWKLPKQVVGLQPEPESSSSISSSSSSSPTISSSAGCSSLSSSSSKLQQQRTFQDCGWRVAKKARKE